MFLGGTNGNSGGFSLFLVIFILLVIIGAWWAV